MPDDRRRRAALRRPGRSASESEPAGRGDRVKARPKTRWRTRVARALLPTLVWSGAGTIVRKNYFEFRSTGSWVEMGGEMQHGWAGTVPPTRWLLVVEDLKGKEHFVGVEADVWERHDVGDVVTAEDPLIAIK